ncbi:MAG: hypothetical protein AAB916_02740 [Patescibacteria group bacterium]
MRFVVSKRPREYLKQGGPTGCGLYAIKGILSAYGKDDGKNLFAYYPMGILPFITTPSRLIHILRSYGFDAKWGRVQESSDTEKLTALKEMLLLDAPVMLHIGNGYRKNGIWSKTRWRIVSHWITLWGFDDKTGVFYIYDPCVPRRYHDKNIPIGNTQRTYEQVLRDCGGSPRWWWRYGYICLI